MPDVWQADAEPLRVGVLGAARIAELAIVGAGGPGRRYSGRCTMPRRGG